MREMDLKSRLLLASWLTFFARVHVLGEGVLVLLVVVEVEGVDDGLRVLQPLVQRDRRVLQRQLPFLGHTLDTKKALIRIRYAVRQGLGQEQNQNKQTNKLKKLD